ncbi:MAG: VIT1/CCC1 transporter family protein [Patescibacteria group bacterium]|nr:VIT1/CCC1 transporter family protein [Patescibacteria group bacterium]
MNLDKKTKKEILTAQRNEITEYLIYKKLSESAKNLHNKEVLKRISDDELRHYDFFKKYTGKDIEPDNLKIRMHLLISKILGITFTAKLMEDMEGKEGVVYEKISKLIPAIKDIAKDEANHKRQLINLINEERLKYMGSFVLGLNDALVGLTAALVGLTFTLQNTRLVAVTGLIIGLTASLSMAASEYLSTKSEKSSRTPLKASIYTGFAYIAVVLILTFPFLILENIYLALGITILNAILIIIMFTFYVSVVKSVSFKKRFSEMIVISFSIATFSFSIGFLLRKFFNIDI